MPANDTYCQILPWLKPAGQSRIETARSMQHTVKCGYGEAYFP